jgi:hypothetical protein
LPELPPVTEIHEGAPVALHSQPEGAVTPTLPVPAAGPTLLEDKDKLKVQFRVVKEKTLEALAPEGPSACTSQ